LSGRLAAADLRRLERACGPALEHRQLPIVVHLERVTDIDRAALGFLNRLAARGASIVRDRATGGDAQWPSAER
jgi:hypothetical protein